LEDVNEFSPVWHQRIYNVEVLEGVLDSKLLRLEAVDEDGSEMFSKICRYNLLTTDVPFKINDKGQKYTA